MKVNWVLQNLSQVKFFTAISLYLGRKHVFQIINSIKGSAAFIQIAIQNKCVMLLLQLCSTMHFHFLNSNHPKREGRSSFVVMSLWPLSLFSSKQDFLQQKSWKVAPCAFLSLHFYLNFGCKLLEWSQQLRAWSCTAQIGCTSSFIR